MRAEEESCGTAGIGMFEEDDPVTWEALAFLGISGATENPVTTTPTRRSSDGCTSGRSRS
jgi:hypothetical protein